MHGTLAHRVRRTSAVLAATLALMVPRSVPAQAPPPAQEQTRSRLVGRVTDTAGVALGSAEVMLLGGSARAITNDSGSFELVDLPAGLVTIAVRRLGYEPATFMATLKPGRGHRADFPLTPASVTLNTVVVEDTVSSWLSTFESRRSGQHGGTFITRKDFANRNLRLASDILRLIPSLSVGMSRTGVTQLYTNRGAGTRRCVPQMYVHTTPYSGTIDDFGPDDIEAIEVYAGISEIPAELNTLGRPICGAVVIWTRAPPPKRAKKKTG